MSQPSVTSTEAGVNITPPINSEIASRRKARYSVAANMKLLPNPDIVLRKAGKTIEAYRDLLKDPHVASCVQSRKSGVFALEWEVTQNNAQTEVSDFVRRQLESLDLQRIMSELLDAPMFGYSVAEVMWQVDNDGYVVADDIVAKPQEWFRFDDRGVPYFTAADVVDGEALPDRKFIVVQHQPSYLNPYGEAVLSRCYWSVTFKKQLLTYMLTFAEKYGMPYLVGYYDSLIGGKAAASEILDKLDSLALDGVAALPNNSTAQILDSAKQASVDVFMGGVTFFNAEVSKAILSQTLTTEQGQTGSYAMSQTHLMVRKDVVDSDKRLIERALNGFVRWLVDINYYGVEAYPEFRLFEQTDVDQALADRDAKLYAMGVRFGADYIAEAYGIDARHITIVDPAAEAAPAGGAFATRRTAAVGLTPKAPAQVEGTRTLGRETAKQLSPDEEAAGEALDMMLKPVIDSIQRGRSYEEVHQAMTDVFPDMDTEGLENLLARSMFMAELVGRASTQ